MHTNQGMQLAYAAFLCMLAAAYSIQRTNMSHAKRTGVGELLGVPPAAPAWPPGAGQRSAGWLRTGAPRAPVTRRGWPLHGSTTFLLASSAVRAAGNRDHGQPERGPSHRRGPRTPRRRHACWLLQPLRAGSGPRRAPRAAQEVYDAQGLPALLQRRMSSQLHILEAGGAKRGCPAQVLQSLGSDMSPTGHSQIPLSIRYPGT